MAVQSLLVLFGMCLLPQAVFSVPQDIPITDSPGLVITAQSQQLGAPTASAQSCGGCTIVADVAGIVWYSEVFQFAAATVINNIYVANQTSSSGRVVATSRRTITASAGQVTITPNSLGGPELQVQYSPTLTIANATLFSPTPYNVFTAYTLTSSIVSDNKCTFSVFERTLETAITQILSSATGVVYVDADQEQKFINSLGFPFCTAGPLNQSNTALVQVSKFTTTVNSIATTLQLLAASRTFAPTTGATETVGPGSPLTFTVAVPSATATIRTTNSNSSTAAPSAHAPLIIVGSTTTITPAANPINLPFDVPPTAIPTLTQVENPSAGGSNILVIIPSGTGSGARNYTATIVPYVSEADGLPKSKLWMSLWVVGLFGLGVVLVL